MTTNAFRFLVLVGSLQIAGSISQAAVCGSLAAVQGKVDVLRNQGKTGDDASRFIVPGKNFLPLECDDVVVTRGQSVAKIIMANGKISMGPDSRIEIAGSSGAQDKPDVNIVNLAYGKVRSLIQKKSKDADKTQDAKAPSPQSNFQVRTHTAVAGVRGTDFYMGYDPNSLGTQQATLSGRVEVEHKESHQKVSVSAGQQVAVESASKADAGDLSVTNTATGAAATNKPKQLVVIPIQESIKHDLRVASAVAKDDKDFSRVEAVKVLGNPETWTIEKESIPNKFNDLKNEF